MSLAPSIIRCISPDADELQEVAQLWNLDFRPMARSLSNSELLQTVDATAALGYARIAPRVEQRGSSPAGMRTFALLGRRSPDTVWCGSRIDRHTLMSFDSGGDFESSTQAGFEVHTLSVDVDHLENLASKEGWERHLAIGAAARAIPLAADLANGLRGVFESATSSIARDSSVVASPVIRECLEVELSTALLRATIPQHERVLSPDESSRERVLRRALEFIGTDAKRAPRISDVCAFAGCSERTLRYAFRHRFGMSPKAYLQAMRLNGVRRRLRHSPGATQIADAANRWGFWHMGQFAADYRRLFGELPSETVSRLHRR